jgi:hypothetical protein
MRLPSGEAQRLVTIALRQGSFVDRFDAVRDRGRVSGEPARRREILTVLAYAPKWDAVALLCEALDDADPDVRARARTLVEGWTDAFHRSDGAR